MVEHVETYFDKNTDSKLNMYLKHEVMSSNLIFPAENYMVLLAQSEERKFVELEVMGSKPI